MPRRVEPKPHPAAFSHAVLSEFRTILHQEHSRRFQINATRRPLRVLDPFAGIGKIHELNDRRVTTIGLELEPEWASQHSLTRVGNALATGFRKNSFDVIATSPCYGNRMADHHNARDGSHRRSYKHYLGRNPSDDSSAVMYWGPAYRQFHEDWLAECLRILRSDGLLVLNISNHINSKKGGEQFVSEWFLHTMLEIGLQLHSATRIPTPRYKFGENSELRPECEFVIVMRKPNVLV